MGTSSNRAQHQTGQNDTGCIVKRPRGHTPDWKSFWDLATPEEMARSFIELYGEGNRRAVGECIRTAVEDGRHEDCRFWRAVKVILDAGLEADPDVGDPEREDPEREDPERDHPEKGEGGDPPED